MSGKRYNNVCKRPHQRKEAISWKNERGWQQSRVWRAWLERWELHRSLQIKIWWGDELESMCEELDMVKDTSENVHFSDFCLYDIRRAQKMLVLRGSININYEQLTDPTTHLSSNLNPLMCFATCILCLLLLVVKRGIPTAHLLHPQHPTLIRNSVNFWNKEP